MKLIGGSEFGGHYRIIKSLGEGGYGSVYQAIDLNLNREVALKLLKANTVSSEEDFKRIKRECILLARLNHPNIVSVFAFELIDDSIPLVAMEYVPGETLASKIALKQKALDYSACKAIIQQICSGLSHAHKNGIIHRDLSTLNVLLGFEAGKPQVKLIDFGLSKLLEPEGGESSSDKSTMALTKTRSLIGNPSYMSPEACRGEKLDAKADIYSLGCVLYEMMSGKKMFEQADPLAILYMQQNQYALPPNPDWEKAEKKELLELLWACLQKDKDKRPESVEVISSFLEGNGRLTSLEMNRAWAAAAQKSGSSTVKLAGLVLFVCLLLSGIAFVSFQNVSKKQAAIEISKSKQAYDKDAKAVERQKKISNQNDGSLAMIVSN